MSSDPAHLYRERSAEAKREEDLLSGRSRVFSAIRIAEFALLVVVISMGLGGELRPHARWIGLAFLLVGSFAVTAMLHERVAERLAVASGRRKINDEGLERIERRWDELPRVQPPPWLAERSLAKDLNLTGRASLLQLLGTAETPMGQACLSGWLTASPDFSAASRRQAATRELQGLLELRQELERRARAAAITKTDEEALLSWSRSAAWYRPRRILRSFVGFLSMAPAVAIAGSVAGEWPAAIPFLAALVNVGFTIFFQLQLHASFAVSERGEAVAEHLLPVFEMAASARFESELLKELATRIGDQEGPLKALRPLERILRAAGLRATGPFYWLLQSLTLWDFHVLARLEAWRSRHGEHVSRWLSDIGELEALSALGTLAFENPEWCFPELVEKAPTTVSARELGHPLLAGVKRVANDFELGAGGTFVLLTGSNMSGKSTFLRTVGINALLAQAGGPVCARSFRIVPVVVVTSLQIEDSLEDGVSFFLAELSRLKEIVDTASRLSEEEGPTALFLLDEMLRGTNSKDRRALAEDVLTFLMKENAAGIVSTHDSALADIPALAHVKRDLHFQETIVDDGGTTRMSFDYRLRPGVAVTTNARQLAEAIGLVERART